MEKQFCNLKKISLSVLLAVSVFSISFGQSEKSISSIEQKGSWYYIYDEKGHHLRSFSATSCELVGYGTDWYIVKRGSWYCFYDIKGHQYKSMSTSSGEITKVNADTFIMVKGSWVYTYDKKGNRIATRSR